MSLPEPVDGLVCPTSGPLVDRFGRVHTYLRVSVTDRCNLRCTYCLPAEGLVWKPGDTLLTDDELVRIVGVFVALGVRRVRLTGGEPLLRRSLPDLVRRLADLGLDDLALTTNGIHLAAQAGALASAGLTRVNVSLDTVDPAAFTALTRGGRVGPVLAGIEAARAAGLRPIKINAVLLAEHGLEPALGLVEHFAAHAGETELRFIEHMPFGALVGRHVPAASLRAALDARYGMTPIGRGPGGPAVRWRLGSGLVVGFISPITEHFCETCNRLRLEADGHLRTCLSRDDTPSLRVLLRDGADDAALAASVRRMVWGKVAGHEAHLDGGQPFEGVMTRIGG